MLIFICDTNERVPCSVKKKDIEHFPGLSKAVKQLDRGISFNKKLKRWYRKQTNDNDSESSLDLPLESTLRKA